DLEWRRDHRLARPASGAIRDHARNPRVPSRYLARQQDQILRRIGRRPSEIARTDVRYAREVGNRHHRQPAWLAGVVADRWRHAGDPLDRLASDPPHLFA